MDYEDNYATCEATYATFRVYSPTLLPSHITELLGRKPSDAWRTGDARRSGASARTGGWLLSTEKRVDSRDIRRHLHWLRSELEAANEHIRRLMQEGHDVDVFCYWVSKSGHGGPNVDDQTMRWLGALGVPLGFDVYFPA